MRTREGEDFLTLNGIQTQSAKVMSLAHRVDELRAAGVDILRLSPQSRQMGRVVELFRACWRATSPRRAPEKLDRLMPGQPCDGYWLGERGWRTPNVAPASIYDDAALPAFKAAARP